MRWAFLVLVILVIAGGGFVVGFTSFNWLLIYILIGTGVLILASSAMWFAWPEPWWPILFSVGALALAAVPGLSGIHPLVAPILALVACAAFFIFYIIAKLRQGGMHGYLLGEHWHITQKGLGGSIFGDVANMIGVLTGVGAYRLVAGDPHLIRSWWWIGQMAAFLAGVVGLSLLWRWAISNPGGGEGEQKWPALFNWAVAAGTLLSLYAPTPANYPLAGITEQTNAALACEGIPGCLVAFNDSLGVNAGWTWLAPMIILVLVSVAVVIVGFRRGRFQSTGKGIFVIVVFIAITIATIITVVFAILGARSRADWTNFGAVIGILAVLAWISGEFFNYVKLTAEWRGNDTYISVLDYLDWEKNFWEIVGGIGTILFVAGNTWRPDWQPTNDMMFIVAAALGFLGTMRGILRGVLKRLYPHDIRIQQELKELRIRAPNRQQMYLAATQEAIQQTHNVQVRDGQIQTLNQDVAQRDQTIQQRDQTIQNLQGQVDTSSQQIRVLTDRIGDVERLARERAAEVERKETRIRALEREAEARINQSETAMREKEAEIARLKAEIAALK
jgi:hypothetical protein